MRCSFIILILFVLSSHISNLRAFNIGFGAEGRAFEESTPREKGRELDINKKPGYEPFKGGFPERASGFEGTGFEGTSKSPIALPGLSKAGEAKTGSSSVTLPITSKTISTDLSLKTPVASLSNDILDASRAYNTLDMLVGKERLTTDEKAQAQKLIQEVQSKLNATTEAAQQDKLLQVMRTNLQSNLDSLLSDKTTQTKITPDALDIVSPYSQLTKLVSQEKLSAEEKETIRKLLDTTDTNLTAFEDAARSEQERTSAASLREEFNKTRQEALDRINRKEPTALDRLSANLDTATQAVKKYTQQGQKALAVALQRVIQLASSIKTKTTQLFNQLQENTAEVSANLLNSATENLDLLKDYIGSAREEWPEQAEDLYHSAVDSLYESASALKDRFAQNELITRLYNQINSLRQKLSASFQSGQKSE